jgi:N-acetylglucosamine malate deacetylase 1
MATVVVFAAHNDDHALAMGGTIAKHFRAGDEVHTFIGSFGELSHPHFRPEIIRKTRVKEAQRADRVLGGSGSVVFLGLREYHFEEDYARKGFRLKLRRRMRALRPARVYLPATDDLHADHKALARLIGQMVEPSGCEVYAYHVYPRLGRRVAPRLHVDVSATYRKKIEALAIFRSQIKFFTYMLTNNIVYVYALLSNGFAGFLKGAKFVETFEKVH